MKNIIKTGLVTLILAMCGCDKFLEEKPDIKMVIPASLADVDLLLNDFASLNGGYPIYGELGTDNYYITQENWNGSSNLDQRNAYIWADELYQDAVQWQRPYKTVFIANQVLDVLSTLKENKSSEKFKRNLGTAYFYRAFSFHQLVEVHCPAYIESTAISEQGIPLRLNPGIDESSTRASLRDSYSQIITDYQLAISNLPIDESVKGRPSKAAAYGGLARVYLAMGKFEQAYQYADSCLRLKANLIDYNTLKSTDALPIPRFNDEVLFSALSANLGLMGTNIALIDSNLYNSYHLHDLRKSIFFKPNNSLNNTFLFKGSYDKSSANLFVGITTSEIYLIKAEAASRVGKISDALNTLNILLKSRWNKKGSILITESNPVQLLSIILGERRKELVFRGRRWSDLKRLNLDPRFQKTLVRKIGDKEYFLEPNSPKYAYRLSETVINLSGMSQNKR